MKLQKGAALLGCIIFSFGFAQSGISQKIKKSDIKKSEVTQPIQIDTLIKPVPTQRALFTTKIERAIEAFDKRDGNLDNQVRFRDDNGTRKVTKALITDAKGLLVLVENMPIDHSQKIRYHKITEVVLRRMNGLAWTDLNADYFVDQIKIYKGMLMADSEDQLNEYVKNNATFEVLDYIDLFENKTATGHLYERLAKSHPEKLVPKLPNIVNEPYADHIVTAAAKIMPATILSYAQSSSSLSGLVRRNNDPLVQTIVKIADNAKNKIKVLPFVGAIYRGEKNIKELDAIADNDDKYLQALVDLIVAKEQMGRADIEKELNIRTMKYVREINALHNSPDATRFKCLAPFRDIDLYIMTIGGQDEIYTSSFTRGTFAQMLKKMDKKSGTQLLEEVDHYHFKSFIRISAGFSRLTEFLNTMTESEKTSLMTNFVNNLEKGGDDELIDAVDVADAYGSIKDPKLIDFLKAEVTSNYERVKKANNEKGIIVYGLLGTIFNGQNNSENNSLPIPPITYVPLENVKNDEGEIIEQMFFYGDSDGKTAYSAFLNSIRNEKRFKIDDSNKYWTKITSNNSTNKVTIYANKPLTEPEDEVAQRALKSYMDDNTISPTVVVHRGHSYFVPTTISYLTPDVKMIVLGSCGGYHNLSQILTTSEDAHIISSKQTGTTVVNETILRKFHATLLSDSEMNWVKLWNDLDKDFAKLSAGDREYFADYVPPNKNLGAIFIKAYKKLRESI